MASKRFGNFQLKEPSAASKKPRLELNGNSKPAAIPSQLQAPTASTALRTPTTLARSSSSKTDYLWGDEDDEFIILASQAVEEVEMIHQSQTADTTFGKFSKEVVTSTQTTKVSNVSNARDLMPPPAAIPSSSRAPTVPNEVMDLLTEDDDVFTEQFDDNYDTVEKHIDDFFNNVGDDFNLDEFRQGGSGEAPERRENPTLSPERKKTNQTEMDRRPVPLYQPKQPPFVNGMCPGKGVSKGRIMPSQQQQTDKEALANAAKKKDHAKDLQVKFLTGQLEMASKKTEKLQTDYSEVLERIQIRDGEVSMLRYELKNVKNQNEQLRLEKMKENETMKKEWVEKMKDLEKVIMAQKADLEFKTMEMMNLKTKRLNNSFRVDNGEGVSIEKPVTEQDFKIHSHCLQRLPNSSCTQYEIDSKIFELSAESISKFNINSRIFSFSKGDAALSQHLGHLQACLSQLVYLKGALPVDTVVFIAQTAHQAIDQIKKYSYRLQLIRVKDSNNGAKDAYDFLCKNHKKSRLEGDVNIYQREPISYNEKAIIQRRFLAALGLLCRYLPSLAVRLMRRQDGDDSCVTILSKALNKVSYSNDLYDHFGMIAAAASLLCGLSYHVCQLEERGTQMVGFLRSIIYCRPDCALTLTHVSEALYRISSAEQSMELINHLCWRSKPECFTKSSAFKMIQFTKDSCILQIYGMLLETSVPQNRSLSEPEIVHLVANTRNTIYFLRNAMARPVRWLRQFFQRSENSSRLVSCQCHIRITNAFVVLFHKLLYCWTRSPLQIEFNTMLQITQNGVLLLFDLFQTVYRRVILQVGGHAIQCRLQATCNWLVQHQNDFRFQQAHS
ncbi:ATR-interacting protein mus304 isoform X2 [Toxorhynchites rutilus septentrionalis]|uniref:ATR-interacting protein mus304 isoform X2 n=1 Tax=Toxorhynchites rutilus septentrionalis TaxID=329112 RepID=UPI00247A5AB6|nr:ATR-interacting protein mus304 isoform X2 [Toxorhynchites rutilus septentrionalis]